MRGRLAAERLPARVPGRPRHALQRQRALHKQRRHGVCDATGTCQCEVGWSGTACNILDEWVVACLVILGLGICTTATFLMRWQYHARQRSRRRARREVRQKRQGRVLRVTGKRTGGYTVQAPGELAGQM